MPIPLRDRKLDWFFILVFSFFAFSSFLVDTTPALGKYPGMRELLLGSYADCDPMFIDPPPFLLVAATVSGFVWGPLYVVFVWAFVQGKNKIRIPALMYSSALTLAMLMIIAEELWSTVPGWRSPRPGKFLAYNLPYLIMPILIGLRMRKPQPFGAETAG